MPLDTHIWGCSPALHLAQMPVATIQAPPAREVPGRACLTPLPALPTSRAPQNLVYYQPTPPAAQFPHIYQRHIPADDNVTCIFILMKYL